MSQHKNIAQELKSYSWFSAFSDELIERLAEHAYEKLFESGEALLEQDQQNKSLYVIRSGTVQVLVDGEQVALIDTPGEIVGEMGVITGLESSATVRAQTQVYCLIIESESLREVQEDERFHLLYKTFAGVLAARIRTTNEKAKKFEEANRELIQAKKELEIINKSLEKAGSQKADDLSQTLLGTLERVVGSATELDQLEVILDEVAAGLDSGIKKKLTGAKHSLVNISERLRPLDQLYNSELAIRSRRVLFLDSNRKQQVVARMALGGTGVDLEIHSSPKDITNTGFDLLFCDAEQVSEIPRLRDANPNGKIVVMVSGNIAHRLEELRSLDCIDHLVSVDPDDKSFTVRNIVSTVTKVLTGNLFGLDKYLTFGALRQKLPVQHSSQRSDLIAQMLNYFKDLGVRRSILENVGLVTEEMLMNAIYDAPLDKNGKPLYNHLPRTTAVALEPHEEAKLSYATDGIYLGVSVSDPFGALKSETLLSYLHSCYTGQAGTMNVNKGGAGRGLHQIIERSNLSIFNVRRGSRTEVISLFLLDSNESRQAIPSLHYFFDANSN